MQIDAWLAAARADAERRGLQDLQPLLETLARSTRALREAHDKIVKIAEIARIGNGAESAGDGTVPPRHEP
jgi:hypothetical protein